MYQMVKHMTNESIMGFSKSYSGKFQKIFRKTLVNYTTFTLMKIVADQSMNLQQFEIVPETGIDGRRGLIKIGVKSEIYAGGGGVGVGG